MLAGLFIRLTGGASQLLARSRWAWDSGFLPWIWYRCILEPAHFIMEWKILLNP